MNDVQAYQECLAKLCWSASQLAVFPQQGKLEKIAELVVESMTGVWRYFHTPGHIFEVGGSGDPHEVLAALFHDIVYVQVDNHINLNLSHHLAPFIEQKQNEIYILPEEELPEDFLFTMVTQIFNFTPGQVLSPFNGQNEFLSALVAVKVLEKFLDLTSLLTIVACIEATIPFRSAYKGLTPSENLYKRLQEFNSRYQLQIPLEELGNITKKSVRVANRDVIGFAYASSAKFLDNTWNLLPETNHTLINATTYTVKEYRHSLQKMENFMNFLRPELIFRQFRNEPSNSIYRSWTNTAKRNLEIARLYLKSKLLAIAIIEALSLRIGKDIPLSTMMGELPGSHNRCAHLEDYIPRIRDHRPPQNRIEQEVLTLLEVGRTQDAGYDIKNSPTSTFLVKSLGFQQVCQQKERAEKFFKGELESEEFLAGLPRQVTQTIIQAVIALFEYRRQALGQNTNNHPARKSVIQISSAKHKSSYPPISLLSLGYCLHNLARES